eukprot:GILI01009294.1.p1 GENE.GILI01009294.1~~GILI01009294.1.p1  ORF type:complete len:100 (+),score=2.21 GILI01009294.1:715-1014(+)
MGRWVKGEGRRMEGEGRRMEEAERRMEGEGSVGAEREGTGKTRRIHRFIKSEREDRERIKVIMTSKREDERDGDENKEEENVDEAVMKGDEIWRPIARG